MKDDPKDAYLERMLEEEFGKEEPRDLTAGITDGLEKPAPASPFRRPAVQIAAGILFFVSIISAIMLVPTGSKSGPEPEPAMSGTMRELLDGLGSSQEYTIHRAEQKLVDMGEDAVPALEQAIPELGDRARRTINRIRWQDKLLGRDEIQARLTKDRITRGVVPTSADSPAPVLKILEERTGVPIVMVREPQRKDVGSYIELNPDSSSYTVLRDALAEFKLVPLVLEGGVLAVDQEKPSEYRIVSILMENLTTKNLERRVAVAGMLVRMAKNDFGYNPYGSDEARRKAGGRILEWWRKRGNP